MILGIWDSLQYLVLLHGALCVYCITCYSSTWSEITCREPRTHRTTCSLKTSGNAPQPDFPSVSMLHRTSSVVLRYPIFTVRFGKDKFSYICSGWKTAICRTWSTWHTFNHFHTPDVQAVITPETETHRKM